jgi:hypothetical protein
MYNFSQMLENATLTLGHVLKPSGSDCDRPVDQRTIERGEKIEIQGWTRFQS